MSSIVNFLVATTTPMPVEEEMAMAEELLRERGAEATSFLGQHAGWLSFLGLVVLVVAIMLIILAGRYRRRGDEFAFQEEPLFDEEMAEAAYDSGYAEVVIEEESEQDGFAQVLETQNEYEGHEAENDDGVPMADHEETLNEVVSDLPEQGDEASPNVVPLRTVSEEPAHEPAAEEPAEEVYEEPVEDPVENEPAPRYAFATGRAAAADASYSQHHTPTEPDHSTRHHGAAASDDHDRPFVAPFIRDDIERSERRQAERVDRLREDFSHQFETIKAEQSSRLDLVIAAIDRKLDSLDRANAERMTPAAVSAPYDEGLSRNVTSLNDQVQRISASIDSQGQRIRAITQILETKFTEVGRVYDEVKTVHEEVVNTRSDMGRTGAAIGDVRGDLDEMKEHVGRLERAILDRAAQDSSTTVRLADVVRGTLPDGTYEFGAQLANGETADCLIRFQGLRHRIAIDGGFPMEAFHELPSRDAVRRNMPQAKTAEDSFRRAILRSILEAADRCISPGETADSCLLFLPSEAAYTILHDRFPDLVRDSQRARVWLVSPSTLMGTLHLVKSLLPDQGDLVSREAELLQIRAHKEEEDRLREETDALRKRAAQLAEELERTRGTLRGLIAPAMGEVSIEEKPAPAPSSAPTPVMATPSNEDLRTSWGGMAPETRTLSQPVERSTPRETERHDDEEIIESLSFEGTPDWQNPLGQDNGAKTLPYETTREGPLR